MEVAYTARNTFNPSYGEAWIKYIEWSKLTQLKELISLDSILCEETFKADLTAKETWENSFNLNSAYFADLYKSIDFILSKIPTHSKFNLLAVVFEPTIECANLKIDNFEFVGYDLLDQDHRTSALTNCGGFEETFSSSELNNYGLINKFERAMKVKGNLLKNNEDEHHADTNVWGVWRHKEIGRE